VLGGAHHAAYIDPSNLSIILHINQIVPPFSILSQGFAKTSITILWTRLMGRNEHFGRAILYINLAILWALSLAAIITTYVQCSPPSLLWTGTPAELAQHCWDPHTYTNIALTQGAYSAFTDFFLALFPIYMVWNLRLNITKKLGLCLLMGFGILYVLLLHTYFEQLTKLRMFKMTSG
jgi:hypothetical protein